MDPRVLRAYQEALASLMASANRDTATLFGRLIRSADPVEVREALELAVPTLVEQYGQVAGELSAEWFTALDPSDGYRPVVPAPTNSEKVARSAAWAAQPLFDGAPAVALSRLSGSVERHVRGVARQTIIHNSERLGVPFARVARADACPFCRMLAGRGFVYADDAAAGGVTGSDYHDACRCVALPKRRGITDEDVPGLETFRDQYYAARSGIANTTSKDDLREILSNMSAAR